MRVLDVGCGSNKVPGAEGLDVAQLEGVDHVHDLDQHPYPLESDSYDRIVMRHVVEHVKDVVGLMREVHRIGKPGARVEIVTPHYSSSNAYIDPTHLHYFSVLTFDFFCGMTAHEHVAPMRFRLIDKKPVFWAVHDRFPWFVPYRWLGLGYLARRHPIFYERFLCFAFPMKEFQVILEVVK